MARKRKEGKMIYSGNIIADMWLEEWERKERLREKEEQEEENEQ